ncbi:MAG: hypothetical protein Q9169_007131, partial [Polycauliona sp. 2 TL-2023]
VALGQIRYLSLPTPTATPIATLLLPILTGLTIQFSRTHLTNSLTHPPSKRRASSLPPWLIPAFFLTLIIYDTVLATLAFTQLIPSDTQTCQLSTRWEHLFRTHSVEALRRIQDTHRCCGLRTMTHMPWPFPDNHGANACRDTYHGRTQSCLAGWRRDLEVNAGLVLVVAIVCFLIKVSILLIIYRRRDNPLTRHFSRGYAALTNNEHEDAENTNPSHRDAVQGRIEAPYRDEPPSTEAGEGSNPTEQTQRQQRHQQRDSSMAVQPSSIHGTGNENEWRS